MGKALRVLVVLLLLASIGALVLELRIFSQRQELKGRNILLTRGVARLAQQIEEPATNVDLTTQNLPRVQLAEDQLQRFYRVDETGRRVLDAAGKPQTQGPGTLDGTLNDLAGKAAVQLARLNDTRTALSLEIERLQATNAVLLATRNDLIAAREDIKAKAETIAQQTQDLESKRETIAKLEEDKEALETKLDAQATEMAALSDKLKAREAQLEATKRYIERLQQQAAGAGGSGSSLLSLGLKGLVLDVNPTWNFVVLDVFPDAQLMPTTELTVQRQDRLVGKVRVTLVRRDQGLAVAEVLPDWSQMPVSKGDLVFY